MKDRFKNLFSQLKLNQQEVADKLAIDIRRLRSYIYETKNYPVDFLQSLIYVFNVNINWLLTGQGDMFNSKNSANDEIKQKVEEVLKEKGII